MLYAGLDIHSKWITFCILDENGKVVRRGQVRTIAEMLRVLEGLPDRFQVCYEASCGYGHFHDLLAPLASRVVVAHSGLLRLIFRSKRKTDRLDAEKLAKLLFLGELPAVHVPRAEVRAWRELITFRRKLIQKRTRAKNGIRALLRSVGMVPPRRPGLWTRRGLAWLKAVEFAQPMHALKRELLLDEIEALSAQLRRVEHELQRYSKNHPAVAQLAEHSGHRAAHRRGGGGLPGRSAPVPQRQGRGELLRAGAGAGPVGPDEPLNSTDVRPPSDAAAAAWG